MNNQIPTSLVHLLCLKKISNYTEEECCAIVPSFDINLYDVYLVGAKEYDGDKIAQKHPDAVYFEQVDDDGRVFIKQIFKCRITNIHKCKTLTGVFQISMGSNTYKCTLAYFKKKICLLKDLIPFERAAFVHIENRFVRLVSLKKAFSIIPEVVIKDPVIHHYSSRSEYEVIEDKTDELIYLVYNSPNIDYDEWMITTMERMIEKRQNQNIEDIVDYLDPENIKRRRYDKQFYDTFLNHNQPECPSPTPPYTEIPDYDYDPSYTDFQLENEL